MLPILLVAAAAGLVGLWKSGDNYIEFRPYKDHFRVEGSAVWPSRKGGTRDDGYAIFPHWYEFSGEARQMGSSFETLAIGDGESCRIWGDLHEANLVVHGDYDCAGTNVNYNGVYVPAERGERIPERADSVSTDPPRWQAKPRL